MCKLERESMELVVLPCSSSSPSQQQQQQHGSSSSSGGGRRQLININDLGDNLLLEILTRLPTKCVCRSKCVSKYWKSHISHPYFARRRHHHHHQQQLMIIRSSPSSSSSLLPPFTFLFNYYSLEKHSHICSITTSTSEEQQQVFKSSSGGGVGGFSLSFLPCYQLPKPLIEASHNDLLLCITSYSSASPIYSICNPLSMQWVHLPPLPRDRSWTTYIGYRLGFLCDPISQQFAIVRVPDFNNGLSRLKRFRFNVFSSRTNRWSKSRHGVRCPRGFYSCRLTHPNSVTWNRIMYWLCNDYIFSYDAFGDDNDNDDDDDHSSRCRFFNLPSEYKPGVSNNRLGVCQGRLRLSQLLHISPYDPLSEAPLSIWDFKEEEGEEHHNNTRRNNNGKWCLVQKFFLKELTSKTPHLVQLLKAKDVFTAVVIGFHPYDADILYLHLSLCVVTCNIRTKTLELACNISPPNYTVTMAMTACPLVLPHCPTPLPTLPPNPAAAACPS